MTTAKDKVRVGQKWGFGMAPIKPTTQMERRDAVTAVVDLLDAPDLERTTAALDRVAVVKGLYSRSFRQDQWDWFTVWQQLGRPDFTQCRRAAGELAGLRTAAKDNDATALAERLAALAQAGGRQHLTAFLTGQKADQPGVGYVYILSTREQPRMLKIGYTDRSVEERVREINRATGVMIPFGVRAVWAVRSARAMESTVHGLLSEYRVRPDREFFQLDFRTAYDLIQSAHDHWPPSTGADEPHSAAAAATNREPQAT